MHHVSAARAVKPSVCAARAVKPQVCAARAVVRHVCAVRAVAGHVVRATRALLVGLSVLVVAGCVADRDVRAEMRLLAFSEYVPQPVIDGFSAEHGVRVLYEAVGSSEQMLAKLAAQPSRYDLILASENVVEALVGQSALLPLDFARLPHFANVGPEDRNLPHDPEQRYSVPWMSGTVGIVVNTERIKTPVKGYRDVFAERHKGRIVVLDDPREMVAWALATLGHGLNDVDPARLEKTRPLLRRWLPLIGRVDSRSPTTAMLDGSADIGIVWSGEAARLFDEHPKYDFVLPAEGAHRFVDSLAIPRGAPHPDIALAFLDYVLRPEVSVLISRALPYTNTNREARKLLTPEELRNPASYPKAGAKLETFRDVGDASSRIEMLVREVRAAND